MSVPENFPKWATGSGTLRKSDGEWIVDTPDGPVKVRFSEHNAYGVLDHWISLTRDTPVYIPMRVIRNSHGCDLIFTLFRLPEMSAEKFAADVEWVMHDLGSAKAALETNAG